MKTRFSLTTEFPSGIPTLSHYFGTVDHHPGDSPLLLVNSDWDLHFVESGVAEYSLKSQAPLKIKSGHFLLLPPFTPFRLESPKKAFRLWFCHFSFNPIPRTTFPSVRWDCLERNKPIRIPLLFSKEEAPKVWRSYRDFIFIRLKSNAPPWRFESALLRVVTELAVFALRHNTDNSREERLEDGQSKDFRIIHLCDRIQENPSFPWRIKALAQEYDISPQHLERIFFTSFGKNLKRHIVEARIQNALRFLNQSSKGKLFSMKEISGRCGFANQQAFSSQFKNFYGISPLKYHLQRQQL